MSKRYGRNQKWKHLEEIARLRAEVESSREQCNSLYSAVVEANSTIDGMVSIIKDVCRNSVAIPPETVIGVAPPDGHMRMPFLDRPVSVSYRNGDCACSHHARHVDLYQLRIFLKDHAQMFCLAVHMRLGNKCESAYMISKEAFESLPVDLILKYMGEDVVRGLIGEIKAHFAKERK